MIDCSRQALINRMYIQLLTIEGHFQDVARVNQQRPHQEPIHPDPDGRLGILWDGLNAALAHERTLGHFPRF